MTADLLPFPTGLPQDPTDLAISCTVRGLISTRRTTQATVIKSLGMSARTFARRLSDGGWTASEVRELSRIFSARVSDFFDAFNGSMLPPADACAWRDSNPQPSDPSDSRLSVAPSVDAIVLPFRRRDDIAA